nr:reverse transcriptase domain-containing protein [Tanacetum cinerariifolium]
MKTSMSNQTNEFNNMKATIAPRGDLNAITTRSGVSYDGPPIPPPFSFLPRWWNGYPRKLHFDLSFSDALLHMPKFAKMFKSLLSNKEKWFDLATTSVNENCLTVLLVLRRPFLRTGQVLIDVYSEELTLRVDNEAITFKGGDFILEEIEACLASKSIPPRIDDIDFDPEGDILLIEKLLNDDPSSHLPQKELNLKELRAVKSSIDDPSELEPKDLLSHLEYAFLEGTDKLPVIIAKNLKEDEKDDFKPAVQHQRKINPKIYEVIKKEVIKLLDAGLIYPISDSIWVSPKHCIPKKGGMTVVTNEDNELIPIRTKKIPPLLTLMERFPTDVCFLVNAMLRARSKVGAVLGQRKTKHFHPIHYASKTMTDAQSHYTTMEKELLAILLLQEFDVIIRDKKGAKNLAANHLSRLEKPHQSDLEKKEITETFPLETLGMVTFRGDPSTL